MAETSPIERAFSLARSGHYRSVSEIIRRLPAEDREAVQAHLSNHEARRELILMCSEAWLANN
jgi:Arc/MetJ-type ribon-helix-helix transcriptional regulator